MSTPGSDTPDPADYEPAATARPARKHRRAVLVLAAVTAVFLVIGLVAVLIAQGRDETNPLDAEAPGLAHFTFHMGDCRYEPDRGGLVGHFDVRTRDAGRFTVDLAAVTAEGADNLDISTPHVVRYTVAFYGGQTRKEFDVVVPLTNADHQQGYRKCRYTLNGAQ